MKKQIVPVVIGVIKKNGKYLLTKRQSPKKEWNKWQFPGGGLEFFEKMEEAVKERLRRVGIEI
jgi:ADP-ribose pyrophosphatase